MEQTDYLFVFVLKFEDSPMVAHAMVTLEGGRQVRIDKTNVRYGEWKKWLSRLAEKKQPAYLVVNKTNNTVEDVFYPEARMVTSVKMSQEQLNVGMLPSPSLFYVRLNHPRFDELRDILEVAHSTMKQAYITTGDDPQEIIDARFSR